MSPRDFLEFLRAFRVDETSQLDELSELGAPPGAAEVDKLCRAVARDLRRATVVPLHGSLPPRDQRRAFQRPPKDSRKVVVSTNVAETSITIDDVVHVVDTGLSLIHI